MTSETKTITVHPNIKVLDGNQRYNLVDLPGLCDSEREDQAILDKMKEDFEIKCPRIDMFVLNIIWHFIS